MNKVTNLVLIIIIVLFSSCSTNNSINSAEIEGTHDRIKFLSEQIKVYSEILDAEYSLYKTDGFTNFKMPALGPTDIHYQFVIKVKPEDVEKWLTELVKIDNNNLGEYWMYNLINSRSANWQYTSEPEYYTAKNYVGPDYLKVVYRREGIIFNNIELN